MTHIFHIATAADWTAAQVEGRYTTSTRGRTLAEEGFLHASGGDQWRSVRKRFYADVTEPLVLLVIETDLLDAPVVEEAVADSTETFPHIYGALNPAAVIQVLPLEATSATASKSESGESFSTLFLREMFFNLALASVVLGCVVVASLVGVSVDADWGALTGTLVGFAIGLPVALALNRRRQGPRPPRRTPTRR